MMVNMNGLSYGTWRNIQKAIEQFDSPVKSSGNYLLKLQEVFTPGHTRQIHVLPKLGKGSLGDAAEYQRVSDKYCWEIIVADDTRFGRHVSVCSYFTEPAFGCEVAEEQAVEPVPETLFDEVYDYIFKLRIDHPDIVMAQCIEESGGFTSKLFVEGHNCLGMKVPGSRPTLAVGTMLGHARFNSWRECIADYAIWQSTFARRLTKDEYFAYLDRVYAEKKGYSGRLKAIIQSRGL